MDIIDATTDSVVGHVEIGNSAGPMCLNPMDNKVYATAVARYWLCVVDGAGDTLIARLDFPHAVGGVAYEPVYNRVYTWYLSRPRTLVVIDGTTNGIVSSVELPVGPGKVLANPSDSTVYITLGSAVSVYRAEAGAVAEPCLTPLLAGPAAHATTVLRGVLMFEPAKGVGRGAPGVLLNIAGRKVMDLVAGANDIGRFAPGVYFVRGNGAGYTTKVMVVR